MMNIKNVLVIGLGEIGSAVKELIEENTDCRMSCIDKYNDEKNCGFYEDIDVVHVCFPEKEFVEFAYSFNDYWYQLQPKYIIIHTTISLNTTKWLEECRWEDTKIFHVPVRGKHDNNISEYLSKVFTNNMVFILSMKIHDKN